jgi:hypothetical protein
MKKKTQNEKELKYRKIIRKSQRLPRTGNKDPPALVPDSSHVEGL